MSLADDVPGCVDAVEIGAGGYGRVYRARQPAFDRTVAVKILHGRLDDSDTWRRFTRECQAIGAVAGHPNIVGVHDAGGTPSGHPYIVMPYLRRGSLAQRLKTETVPWQQVVTMGIKIAGALHSAHRAGVLHRDIKPENILLSDYGEPQLADFGIAQRLGSTMATTTAAAMTPAQGAPELLAGERPSVASDVYGLASTLHTLIRGVPPFVRRGEESVFPMLARIATEPPPDLRADGVPDAVARVIEHGMAKAPQDRPADALRFGQELQQAQGALGLPVTVLPLAEDDDGGAPRSAGAPPPAGLPGYPQRTTPPPPPPAAPLAAPVPAASAAPWAPHPGGGPTPQQWQGQPPGAYPTPATAPAGPPGPPAGSPSGPAPARRSRATVVVSLASVLVVVVAGALIWSHLAARRSDGSAAVAAALLTPADLGGTGWRVVPSAATADQAFCNRTLPVGTGDRAAVTLQRGEPAAAASQRAALRVDGGAAQLLETVRSSANGCSAWTAVEGGEQVAYTLRALPAQRTIGQKSAEYVLTRTVRAVSLAVVQIYVVQDDVLSVVSYAGRATSGGTASNADVAFAENLARTGAQRLADRT
jgi:serine/threonine-protein kinase PknK